MGMTERQQRRLWRHVESIDGFWETLKEIEPGIVARLAALASERRWELIFLTKRPESAGATAQVQTQRWLQAHGFTLPSVFVVQGSRGRVADAFNLDFVIDDRPENCLDVVLDSTTRALLVWREDEALLPAAVKRPGVQVVQSMAECLAILEQAGRTDAASARDLIGWLKRRLGIGAELRIAGIRQPGPTIALPKISQRVQSDLLEVVDQRRSQRVAETRAQLLVGGMFQIRCKPGDVVEIDRDEVVGGIRHLPS